MENKILFYGTLWCGDCKRSKKVFEQHNIDFNFINIDNDREGELFVKNTNNGSRSVPTIVFPDGDILVEPNDNELSEKLMAYKSLNPLK